MHGDDRRARLVERVVVLVVVAEQRLQLELGLLAGLDEQHLGAERLGDELDHLVGQRLRAGDHLARVEQQAHEVGRGAVQLGRELLDGAAALDDDLALGDGRVGRRELRHRRGTEVLEVATTTLLAPGPLTLRAGTTTATGATAGTAAGTTAATAGPPPGPPPGRWKPPPPPPEPPPPGRWNRRRHRRRDAGSRHRRHRHRGHRCRRGPPACPGATRGPGGGGMRRPPPGGGGIGAPVTLRGGVAGAGRRCRGCGRCRGARRGGGFGRRGRAGARPEPGAGAAGAAGAGAGAG